MRAERQKIVARSRAKQRRLWKSWKTKFNASGIGLKKIEFQNKKARQKFVLLVAPENMSFLDNTQELLEYLDLVKSTALMKKGVITDFRNIKHLSNDALVLMLATVNDPSMRSCDIRGNYPLNPNLRKILEESGLFGPKSSKNNYIISRRNKKADGKIANAVIKRSCRQVFGDPGRCPGIYRALMESMANTCYHAEPNRKAHELWFLTVFHNKQAGSVSFAFVDLGVGIFKSRKVRLLREKLASSIGLSNDCDVLKQILSGERRSSTDLSYRGKGLPAIFKGLSRNYYSSLKIISNTVKADLENDTFENLNKEFKGTFLYWELNNTNRWIRSK